MDWPRVIKTPTMQVMESKSGMDVRDLILNEVRRTKRRARAAAALGISQTLFAHWIHRLGIYEQVLGAIAEPATNRSPGTD